MVKIFTASYDSRRFIILNEYVTLSSVHVKMTVFGVWSRVVWFRCAETGAEGSVNIKVNVNGDKFLQNVDECKKLQGVISQNIITFSTLSYEPNNWALTSM